MNSKQIRGNIFFGTLLFFMGAIITYLVVINNPIYIGANIEGSVTKIEKDVTITETGISEAVDKVYDSVVVVSTYKGNTLYGTGSGFIYKVEGNDTYIITNHHVIENGTNFKITYTDKEIVEATLVGSDELSDIALLKVETRDNYEAVELGKSSDLKAGDTTFAVGAPLGNTYSWTVTRGIISGKERLVEISTSNSYQADYIMNVLQTDAAVNSGNSGGPLCNSNGEVVGVISAKIASTGVEGMGFAIPIEVALDKVEQILNNEEVKYPYIGISMINVSDVKNNPRYYSYLTSTEQKAGVIIQNIEKNTPADNANLKTGDIITKINGVEVSNIAYLRYELYKYKVGEEIEVTYVREDTEYKTKLTLASKDKSI